MTETQHERARRLAGKTADAYSFDRYGEEGWRAAAKALVALGLTDRQVEAWMRSKHMRWACDADESRAYGRHNGKTVKEYVGRNKGSLSEAELARLVAGTFDD